MNAIGERLATAYPDANNGYGIVVDPYPRPIGLNVEPSLYLLFAAVGIVLLIACVNLASLALARGRMRTRDVAIQAAVGASRAQLVWQCLIEHLLIAGGGAVCGGLIGYGFVKSLTTIIPTTGLRAAFPPDTVIRTDVTIWLFTLAVAACCGIAFGLGAGSWRDTFVAHGRLCRRRSPWHESSVDAATISSAPCRSRSRPCLRSSDHCRSSDAKPSGVDQPR
jgi:hypothetical protein